MAALPGYSSPSYFNPSDYIADGDRDAFTRAFQPRIGFSYDLFGDQSTVIFGGAGRYYDRIGFNFPFDERFKPTQFIREVFFSADGPRRPGTVAWDPAYLTPRGLDPLLAATPGAGEVFLIRNDAPPPRTDQFNLGLRQQFGDWQLSATLAYAFTKNEFSWYFRATAATHGNASADPRPHRSAARLPQPSSSRTTTANALYGAHLTADKPYNRTDGWGFSSPTPCHEATQNGSRGHGLVNFDFHYDVGRHYADLLSPTRRVAPDRGFRHRRSALEFPAVDLAHAWLGHALQHH